MSEKAATDVFRDGVLADYGECDARVPFSAEQSEVCAFVEPRPSDQQMEIIRLYDDLRPSLYAYLYTLGLTASEAEEVIQEGFFRLVRDLTAGSEVRNPPRMVIPCRS